MGQSNPFHEHAAGLKDRYASDIRAYAIEHEWNAELMARFRVWYPSVAFGMPDPVAAMRHFSTLTN
ncbi:hypothetical protein [Paraburkholderia sp. GAS348]|uniref:hypothetical protein n=1 Tax=Paraburkholderia sp. GAS348 TaxID=3035132 RepID=UPI003D1EDA43